MYGSERHADPISNLKTRIPSIPSVAAHQLQRRLQTLRSRLIRLLLVRGLSVIVASVVAVVIGLGLIDFAVRFRDRGVLVISSACVLAIFAWTVYRFLGRLRGVRLGDTELALRIEACFPAVKDRLASAVEFLKQTENDAAAGSAAMRRAAIAQATAQCDHIDFGSVLNLRPAFRAVLTSLTVCLLATLLVALNPAAARVALARLALPLGNAVWPQATHLQLKGLVQRVARGQPLEIEVVDARGANLPATCRVHYRFRDSQGKPTVESEAMRPLGQAMIARRENITRPLEFRVTGGDDRSMPWMPVEVLDPPAVASLAVEVVPPAYANWLREKRDAASAAPILAGSRVELSGEASKPLRSAVLRLDSGREFPARIEGDGRLFRIGSPSPELPAGLVLDKPCGFTIALVDRDGVQGGKESWQFRVQTDSPPGVVIEQPKGDFFVTPRARIDLRLDARDDLALQRVALAYSASGATAFGETSLSLYEGPPQPAARAAAADEARSSGDHRTIDRRWNLENLKVQAGTKLSVYAAATDYRGQAGRSEPRTITIVTPEELQDRLAARQGKILAELSRLLQIQRDARDGVRHVALRLQESGGLEQADIDRLQSADSTQREIARSLTGPDDGASALAQSVLADLEISRIDNPDCARRMVDLLAEFGRLQREDLVSIGDELTAAITGAQTRVQSPPRPAGRDVEGQAHLASASKYQQHVIDSLEDMLSQLRQWDDYRRFQRDVAQLFHDQEEIARGAAELGRQTLGRDLKELLPQQSADLKALVERQSDFARRQNRLEQEMEQTIPLLRPREPLAADTLGDALAEARRLAIAAAMQNVAEKIRDNGLGQAPADHQAILQNLQSVLDILANNRSQESQRLARELAASARDLDGLRKRQEGLRRKLDELAAAVGKGQPNEMQRAEFKELANLQDQTRQETLQLGRRLERLWVREPAESTNLAAEKMDQVVRDCSDGMAPPAGEHARIVGDHLADADAKLRQKRDELRVQIALEQQARLQDAIRHLHGQESQIAKETLEFAGSKRNGPLSRAQVFGLLELARQQSLLSEEAGRLAASLDPAQVFRLGLSDASEDMRRAAEFLQDQHVGAATQQAEQAAIDRLALLLAAMEPENTDNSRQDDIVRGGPRQLGKSDNTRPDRPAGGMIMLAEVKYLKLWQEDLNRRTQQLDLDAAGKPRETMRERYDRLADEQARLAAATVRLLGSAAVAPQNNAEAKKGDQNDKGKQNEIEN
jgi:hypothetical protein